MKIKCIIRLTSNSADIPAGKLLS